MDVSLVVKEIDRDKEQFTFLLEVIMKIAIVLILVLVIFGCSKPSFTVYPDKSRGNERPLVYDSSEISTVFESKDSDLEMSVALHSREFPNGIMWTLSLKAEDGVVLPLKMFAYQDEKAYELIRLQSDQNYPNYAYYVLPPNFLKNCRFTDQLTLSITVNGETYSKVTDNGYVENFGMFYSFVNIDIKRNTSILFIH